jgi:hypothetical protein
VRGDAFGRLKEQGSTGELLPFHFVQGKPERSRRAPNMRTGCFRAGYGAEREGFLLSGLVGQPVTQASFHIADFRYVQNACIIGN